MSDNEGAMEGQPSKKLRRDKTPRSLRWTASMRSPYGWVAAWQIWRDKTPVFEGGCWSHPCQILRGIKTRRLAEPLNSPYRMTDICQQIPDSLSSNHDYHWECYKRFTINLTRLRSSAETLPSTSRLTRESGDSVLFKPECIFCDSEKQKKIKVKGSWTTEDLSRFEFGGWQDIEHEAELQGDEKLLTRVRGKDLFACEAMYHRTFRKSFYIQDPKSWRSDSDELRNAQNALETAHKFAFGKCCEFVEDDVVLQKKMVKLTDLNKIVCHSSQQNKFPQSSLQKQQAQGKA